MHEGHRNRLRKKFLTNGLDKLEEHEILELLLFYAMPRKNMNGIAHELIDKFGSLVAVFDAPFGTLQTIKGIGENSATFLKLIPEICRIYLENKYNSSNSNLSLKKCKEMLKMKFIGMTEEAVGIILFDAKGKIVYNGIINRGSVNAVDVYIRRIIELIIMYNACSILLAHNHPSGITTPSTSDINSTIRLNKVLSGLKVNFLDHIIVSGKDIFSMRDKRVGNIFDDN